MITISQKALDALEADAKLRGTELVQRCPKPEPVRDTRALYLGPNGERLIIEMK